jgi:hypothetical protein
VGLGLTLVESVAKVHGGLLELADNNPGLRVHMIIPAQPTGAPGASHSAPSEVAVAPGAAAVAHNLRIRSVS